MFEQNFGLVKTADLFVSTTFFMPRPPFRRAEEDEFRRKLGGLVVVASNAGGAWTPMGDLDSRWAV